MTDSHQDVLTFGVVESEQAFVLREDEFRLLYDRTSRPLWLYLHRLTQDAHAADDLLQETYYRFLRGACPYETDAHEQNALYRIATNLARDRHRRLRLRPIADEAPDEMAANEDGVATSAERTDVQRTLANLRPRDRQLLWLAYAEGSTHQEIAERTGLRVSSIRTLLARARQRFVTRFSKGRQA